MLELAEFFFHTFDFLRTCCFVGGPPLQSRTDVECAFSALGVAVPETSRSGSGSLDVPLNQDCTSCSPAGVEDEVLHLHVTDGAFRSNLQQDLRVAATVRRA